MLERGLAAEFDSAEALLHAARALRHRGFTRLDAFTPYGIPELDEALGLERSRLTTPMLVCALTGGVLAYLVQWWCNAVDYPLNVGGRPFHAAPAFIPIVFETTVLLGVLGGLAAWLWTCKLPRLWHPLDEVPGVQGVSKDRFWLGLDAADPWTAEPSTRDLLRSLGAQRVLDVGGGP